MNRLTQHVAVQESNGRFIVQNRGGCANFKLADGTPALRTEAEKAAEIAARPAPEPTPLDRVEAQITYTAMITDTMLEV